MLTRLRWIKGVTFDPVPVIQYRVWETVVVMPGEDATYNVEVPLAEHPAHWDCSVNGHQFREWHDRCLKCGEIWTWKPAAEYFPGSTRPDSERK